MVTAPTPAATPRRGRRATPPAARFWPKVDVGAPDECWPWTAGRNGSDGYGCFRIDDDRRISAHAYAKELTDGPCPDGMHPQHTCKTPDSKLCCNPTHIVYARPGATSTPRGGENHPKAKLSFADVCDIRRRAAAGERTTDLANEYGVTLTYLSIIKRGHTRTTC